MLTRNNSLDVLRLIAAFLVLYSHQHALIGVDEPSFFGLTSAGGLGVSIFFFLSGMLIYLSWLREPKLSTFFFKRSLRIFPGLIFVVFFVMFVLGPIFTTLSLSAYFSNSQLWNYLITPTLWIQHQLPGVFENNPFTGSVNGSLWTLPLEFLCYISIAIAGVLGFFRNGNTLAIGLLLVITGSVVISLFFKDFTTHFNYIMFFWWGSVFAYLLQAIKIEGIRGSLERFTHNKPAVLIALSIVIMFTAIDSGAFDRVILLVLVSLFVFVALAVPYGKLLSQRIGDLSYGVYIFAFPVQQSLIEVMRTNQVQLSIMEYFLLSSAITCIFAWISWHYVELKALSYRRTGAAS